MAVNKANIISKIHQLTLIIFEQYIMLQLPSVFYVYCQIFLFNCLH